MRPVFTCLPKDIPFTLSAGIRGAWGHHAVVRLRSRKAARGNMEIMRALGEGHDGYWPFRANWWSRRLTSSKLPDATRSGPSACFLPGTALSQADPSAPKPLCRQERDQQCEQPGGVPERRSGNSGRSLVNRQSAPSGSQILWTG